MYQRRSTAASVTLVLVAGGAAALRPPPAFAALPTGCTRDANVVTCTTPNPAGTKVEVPAGMNRVGILAQGGAGGDGSGGMDPGRGGPGGTATALFPVSPGQVLRLFV